MSKRRVVVLDRDGTVIVERCHRTDPDEVEFLPGTGAGVRGMQGLGLTRVVMTNPPGIGSGLFDETRRASIHERLR